MKTLRNEADRAAILNRLSSLTGDEVAVWGKMSVTQMMSHLVQANEMPFTSDVPERSNFFSRTLIKPLMLHVLPIPKGVKTSAQLDQQQDGRPPTDLESDRTLVIGAINKLATLAADHKCLNHPFFGPMTAPQWAAMAHKHIDHHLKQFGV